MGSESACPSLPVARPLLFFIRHRERPCRQAHIRALPVARPPIHKLVPLALKGGKFEINIKLVP